MSFFRRENCAKTFDDPAEMDAALIAMDKQDRWIKTQVKDFCLIPITEEPPPREMRFRELGRTVCGDTDALRQAGFLPAEIRAFSFGSTADPSAIAHKYGLKDVSDDDIRDCMSNSSIVISTGEESFLLSSWAWRTLCDRAMNNADILRRMGLSDLCHMLNLSWAALDKTNALLLVRGGKVLAIHSGAKNGYVPLPQGGLFESVREQVDRVYPGSVFSHGMYAHDLTTASWRLLGSRELFMKKYIAAWRAAKLPEATLANTIPVLEYGTSDIGVYCATLVPRLMIGKEAHRLGSAVTVKHHGDASLDKLEEVFQLLFVGLQKGIDSMSDLLTITLNNPVETARKIAKTLKLPKGPTQNALQLIELTAVPGQTTAYEVYFGLYEILNSKDISEMTAYARLVLEEQLSRMLALSWTKIDNE